MTSTMVVSPSSSSIIDRSDSINARTRNILGRVKSRLRLSSHKRSKVRPTDPNDPLSTPSDLTLSTYTTSSSRSRRQRQQQRQRNRIASFGLEYEDDDTTTSTSSDKKKDTKNDNIDPIDKYWDLSGDLPLEEDEATLHHPVAQSEPFYPRSSLHRDNSETSDNDNDNHHKKKRVSFSSSLRVQSYPPVLGDNPYCSGGLAVECDWQPESLTEVNLEAHEAARATPQHRRRSTGELQLSWSQRKNRLTQSMNLTTMELIRLESRLMQENNNGFYDSCYW